MTRLKLPSAATRHPRRGKLETLRRISTPQKLVTGKIEQDKDWWRAGLQRADPSLAVLMSGVLEWSLQKTPLDSAWQLAALMVMLRTNQIQQRIDPSFAAVDVWYEKEGPLFVLEALCLSQSLEVTSQGASFWLEWSYGHSTPLTWELGPWERLRQHLALVEPTLYQETVEHAQLWRSRSELPLRCSLSYLCSERPDWAVTDLQECSTHHLQPYGWRLFATLSECCHFEATLERYGLDCPEEWMWCLYSSLQANAMKSLKTLLGQWVERSLRDRQRLALAVTQLGPPGLALLREYSEDPAVARILKKTATVHKPAT